MINVWYLLKIQGNVTWKLYLWGWCLENRLSLRYGPGIISTGVVFKSLSLDEITKGVGTYGEDTWRVSPGPVRTWMAEIQVGTNKEDWEGEANDKEPRMMFQKINISGRKSWSSWSGDIVRSGNMKCEKSVLDLAMCVLWVGFCQEHTVKESLIGVSPRVEGKILCADNLWWLLL